MDGMEAFRSPPNKAEQRWGRDDTVDRSSANDVYRTRRSPGKLSLRQTEKLNMHFKINRLLSSRYSGFYP